jgi:DNA-binding NarL/FixJ family response regulator
MHRCYLYVGSAQKARVLLGRSTSVLGSPHCCNRNHEIAARLGVAVGTVEFHVRNILRELDLTSRYELREALSELR